MTSLSDWTPKSIQVLRGYSGQKFFGDLIAGITVGLGGIPLAMAFAISSGLKPENGMYCAVVAGLLGALLSGSKTQISGPTGAFVVVVAGIVATHGVDGLFHVTMIAGVPRLEWARFGDQIHSPPGRHRIYKRHRCTYCEYPD